MLAYPFQRNGPQRFRFAIQERRPTKPLACGLSSHFFGLSLACFRRRTPGPPPFSSMNSTSAASKARRTARSSAAVIDVSSMANSAPGHNFLRLFVSECRTSIDLVLLHLKPSSSLFVFRGLTLANAGASAPDRRKPLHNTCSKRNFTVLIPRPVIRLDHRHENVELVTLWRPNGRSAKLLDLRKCGPVGFISADRADLHGGPLQNLATVRASVAPAPMSSPPKACTVQTAFWLLPLSNSEAIIDVTETLRAAARRSERS